MSLTLLIILVAGTIVLLLAEHRSGHPPLALDLKLKGDIKRESWWLQQYGQAVCTPVVGWLIWELDPVDSGNRAVTVVASVALTSVVCGVLKRLFGRVRPLREHAGKFLGPNFRLFGSHHQSFPSSHAAGAVALTTALTVLYPHAWPVLWFLAISCAVLRYILDAHWPSDIVAGAATGYVVAHAGFLIVPPIFRILYNFVMSYL